MHLWADAWTITSSYGWSVQISDRARREWERLRSLPIWILDAVITVLVGGLAIASAFGSTSSSTMVFRDHDWLSYLLAAALVLPYLFRRRYPFVVLSVSSIALTIYIFLGYHEGGLPTMVLIGVYTVGAYCDARRTAAAFALLVASMATLYLDPTSRFDLAEFVATLGLYATALMFGWAIQSRRQKLDAVEAKAEALEREQKDAARLAVTDERLRIAQELHDVMAHSMSVIAVQAGVGMHVIDTEPSEAKIALENISTASRSTLGELRRLLGVLREEDEGSVHAPAPGIGELGKLVREMETAGLPVVLRVDQHLEVPGGVDLTAYRIVQESLTNVLKHAGPARASVEVTGGEGILRIEVRDDGRGVNGRSTGVGHGLVGMRERVAVYGGVLSVGPLLGGGFRVMAELPWGATGHEGDS